MNRAQRRAAQSLSRRLAAERPEVLTEIPRQWWPPARGDLIPLKVWQSSKYLVQMYEAGEQSPGAKYRLSVCRCTMNQNGRWDAGISWEELQQIKREIGFGDSYAVEIYPPDAKIVNVANMRHLWICEVPLPIGWMK